METPARKQRGADKTARILDVKYFMLLPQVEYVGTPYDTALWSALLKSAAMGARAGVILFTIVITAIYVRRANSEFDDLSHAIITEVHQ